MKTATEFGDFDVVFLLTFSTLGRIPLSACFMSFMAADTRIPPPLHSRHNHELLVLLRFLGIELSSCAGGSWFMTVAVPGDRVNRRGYGSKNLQLRIAGQKRLSDFAGLDLTGFVSAPRHINFHSNGLATEQQAPNDCTDVFGGSDSSSEEEEEEDGDYDNLEEVSLEERSGNYRGSDDEPAE